MHENLEEVVVVAHDQRQVRLEVALQQDFLWQARQSQLAGAIHQRIEISEPSLWWCLPRKGEKIGDQILGAPSLLPNLFRKATLGRGNAFVVGNQFRISQNGSQGIVQFMCGPGDKAANGSQLL